MFQRIYNNPILLYTIGLVGGLFWLFVTFQDYSDFIKREFVESLSFFFVIMCSILLIQEISKKLTKQEEEQVESENIQSSQENLNTHYPQFQSFDNEKVVYEWEEEDELETESEQKADSSKEKIEELEAKIKQLEQALTESEKREEEFKKTKKVEKPKEQKESEKSQKKKLKINFEEEKNQDPITAGFTPESEDSPMD